MWKYTRHAVNRSFLLIPTLSNGDILILYRMLHELMRVNQLQYTTIILDKGCANAASNVGLSDMLPLSAGNIIAMSKAVLFTPECYRNCVYSCAWHVFDVRSLLPDVQMLAIPSTVAETTVQSLVPGGRMRCVILSPYEQSNTGCGEKQLELEFWVLLVDALKRKGLEVYTNCDGIREPPIPGTEKFFPRFSELSGAVSYAGYCVSVRSGFTDWVSSASEARQVVLYPSRHFYDLFNMKKVWGSEHILELIYGDSSWSAAKSIEEIVAFLTEGKREL